MHAPNPVYSCIKCEKVSKTKSAYNKHKLLHFTKHTCTICKKTFNYR